MAETVIEETGQTTLLDLDGKQYNAYWVDEKQPLFIPNNPLHWRAHKLQVLLDRLDKQAAKNPAQFNSRNYLDTLAEYTKCVTAINEGKTDEILDEGRLDSDSPRSKAPEVGDRDASGVDSGVSADNPLAR